MKLTDEQDAAVTHIYERGETFIYGPMGSGKTVTAYTAAEEMLRDGIVKRVLIFAPPSVAKDVWPNELAKWPHLREKCKLLAGGPVKRLNVLSAPENLIVSCSINLIPWLVEQSEFKTFDMLIIDESTKMKAHGVGVKALRKCLDQFNVRVAMTGTPVSENTEQLFYQIMLVDGGKAFGKNRAKFLKEYFEEDFTGYKYTLRPWREREFYSKIKHLVVELPAYKESPPLSEHVIKVKLPALAMDYYKQFARDSVNDTVTADSAAILVNKLHQIACGFVYTDDGAVEHLHVAKTSALSNLLPSTGRTVIAYQYKEELKRLKSMLPVAYEMDRLNEFRGCESGELLIHPKSAGHGLDITCANTLVFMSAVWSRDLVRQTIARLWRRGQELPVNVYFLVGEGTIEEEIVRREGEKATHNELLVRHLGFTND